MENQTKDTIVLGEDFNKAIDSAAELKKETLTLCKSRNRNNFEHFYDLMVASNREIQSILDMKAKDRRDAEKNMVKEFKKDVSATYKGVCELLSDPEPEEGEESKVQKLVRKVAVLVKMLDYIGYGKLEEEFSRYGISLKYEKLDESDTFSDERIREDVKEIFTNGKSIKEDVDGKNLTIKESIFETAVPRELQYDKETNPTGLKSSDFCKLVAMRTKFLMAQDDESKEKAEEKASDMAGDCEFSMERSRLMQLKLTDLSQDAVAVNNGKTASEELK